MTFPSLSIRRAEPGSPPVGLTRAALIVWFYNILLAANLLAFLVTQAFHTQNGILFKVKFYVYRQPCSNWCNYIYVHYSRWNWTWISIPYIIASFTWPFLLARKLELHALNYTPVLSLPSLWEKNEDQKAVTKMSLVNRMKWLTEPSSFFWQRELHKFILLPFSPSAVQLK